MKDVTGFGAINIDFIYRLHRFPDAGQEVPCKKVGRFQGGSSLNTCVNLGKMNYDIGFIGAMGNDGDEIFDDFFEYVDLEGVMKKEAETGKTNCFIDKSGERTILVDPGANGLLEFEDVSESFLFDSEYLLIGSFVDDEQFELQKKFVKKSPESTDLVFTPGHLYSQRGLAKNRDIIEESDFVFLNESEAGLLTGKCYRKACERLIEIGAKNVTVTRGKDGVFLKTPKLEENLQIEDKDAIDTTGAGDAFVSGFLSGLLKEKNLLECAKMGHKIAEISTQSWGARIEKDEIPRETVLNDS